MRRLNIQLTEEQYETLRILAFRERRSLADVIREAIEKHLKEEEAMRFPKPAPEKSVFQLHAEAFYDAIEFNFRAAGPNPTRGNLEAAIEAAWANKSEEVTADEAREGEALARKLLGKN